MNYSIPMSDPVLFASSVDCRIQECLALPELVDPGSALLSQAAAHLCTASGAKHFRPKLVHLFGQLFDLPEEPLLRIAVGAELIHAASLLHDDVIDEGTERRGRPTANVQWSNSVAILAGDWLLTRATLEVAPLGAAILEDAIATVGVMTAAAVREVEARGRTALTLPHWRHLAEGKAGELFAWCLASLATLGHRPELVEPLRDLGRKLGVSFQMGDNLKDILDDRGGKDRFADLKNQNPSFALVVAMDGLPALRDEIDRAWHAPTSPSEVAAVGQAIIRSGALDRAQGLLRDEVQAALALLSALAPPRILHDFIGLASTFAGRQAGLLQVSA